MGLAFLFWSPKFFLSGLKLNSSVLSSGLAGIVKLDSTFPIIPFEPQLRFLVHLNNLDSIYFQFFKKCM